MTQETTLSEIEMNCLSYWYPKIRDAGLPVPRTKIVRAADEILKPLMGPIDGEPFGTEVEPFFAELRAAVESIGLPCFLRTGQGSGKHEWKDCCYLTEAAALESHVLNLINWSECVDFMGLPWNVWCVREFLPTRPLMSCEAYGGMPVCKEFRFFVRDGEVVCKHPYWPAESILQGMTVSESMVGQPFRRITRMVDRYCEDMAEGIDDPQLEMLASRAGKKVGGDWSIDLLDTERGWFVTDMALADRSFHWDGCEHAASFRK